MSDSRQRPVVSHQNRTVWQRGDIKTDADQVATECAVALVYNGVSHAVMMATPKDLHDFALGFSLSEGILESPAQLLDCEEQSAERGIELQLSITAGPFAALKERRKNLAGRTGCGLCGAESLVQAVTMPQPVSNAHRVSHTVLQSAASQLGEAQSLQQMTGAVHAAGWFNLQGELMLMREDVGRHNALDKLLGAFHKAKTSNEGFIVITSRASYEMVSKTATANVGILAAVSGPTSLAIDYAQHCGLTLVGFTRPGRHAIYTHPERLLES